MKKSASSLAHSRILAAVAFAGDDGSFSHRRAGFAFGKEPVCIGFSELGASDAEALDTLILIASDPHLRVTLIDQDDNERVLNDGERHPESIAIAELEAERSALRATAN